MNETKIWMELFDTPDAYFYELAFVQIPPVDRSSFLYMLDMIGQVSNLCVYRVETVDIKGSIAEFFEEKINNSMFALLKTSRDLYIEIYGRN